MILDFNFHNPTRVYFGKTALDNLSAELANYGKMYFWYMVKVQ